MNQQPDADGDVDMPDYDNNKDNITTFDYDSVDHDFQYEDGDNQDQPMNIKLEKVVDTQTEGLKRPSSVVEETREGGISLKYSRKKPRLAIIPKSTKPSSNVKTSENMPSIAIDKHSAEGILGTYVSLQPKTILKLSQQSTPNIFIPSKKHEAPIKVGSTPILSNVTVDLRKDKMTNRNMEKQTNAADTIPNKKPINEDFWKLLPSVHGTTVLLDSIGSLDSKPKEPDTPQLITRRPLARNPNLFVGNLDILPGYQADQQLAEDAVQQGVCEEVKSRILDLKESDLSFPPGKEGKDPITQENTFLSSRVKTLYDLTRVIKESFFSYVGSGDLGSLGDNVDMENLGSSSTLQLTLPHQEVCSRRHNFNFLREAFPWEPTCLSGPNCESVLLWQVENIKYPFAKRNEDYSLANPGKPGLKYALAPFRLPRFLLPSERLRIETDIQNGKSRKEAMSHLEPGLCILCKRSTVLQLATMQKSGLDGGDVWPIQDHSNLFNEPGEYISEVAEASSPDYCGMIRPTVSYNRSHYTLGHYYACFNGLAKPTHLEDGRSNSKSTTVLIPENSTIGSKPPEDLIRFVGKELSTDSVKMTVVNGWLEIEDIIFKPTTHEPYVKVVTETYITQGLDYGLNKMGHNLTRSLFTLPLTISSIIVAILDIDELSYPIFTDPWDIWTKSNISLRRLVRTVVISICSHYEALVLHPQYDTQNMSHIVFYSGDIESTRLIFINNLVNWIISIAKHDDFIISELFEQIIHMVSIPFKPLDVSEIRKKLKGFGVGNKRLIWFIGFIHVLLLLNIPKLRFQLFLKLNISKLFTPPTKAGASFKPYVANEDVVYQNSNLDDKEKKYIDMDSYLKLILKSWDNIHLPMLKSFLKGIQPTKHMLVKLVKTLDQYKCKYTKELQLWIYFTEKYGVKSRFSESEIGRSKWTYKSPLIWIHSDYMMHEPYCTQYLEMIRTVIYPRTVTAAKSLPLFDEILRIFNNISRSITPSDEDEELTNEVIIWFKQKTWLNKDNSVFQIVGIYGSSLLELPELKNHAVFWTTFYCIHRLDEVAREIREKQTDFYRSAFNVKETKKDILRKLETFINQLDERDLDSDLTLSFDPNDLEQDQLDYSLQCYMTCFLDLVDWFLDMMRQGKPIDDKHTPLMTLYPHPAKDLGRSVRYHMGSFLPKIQLWSENSQVMGAIPTLYKKGLSARSFGRSLYKKVGDCGEKSNAMVFYLKQIGILTMMGLQRNSLLLHQPNRNTYVSLPTIYRPNFSVLYYTYRYFFDRRFGDTYHRYEFHDFINATINSSGLESKGEDYLKPKTEDTFIKSGKHKLVIITEYDEASIRKHVYETRHDALVPVSNDFFINYLEKEPKLSNSLIAESLIGCLTMFPQYWSKYRDPKEMESSLDKKEVRIMHAIEPKWRDYFIKSIFWNNVYRFNIQNMIDYTFKSIYKSQTGLLLKPWEFDTVMCANIRKISIQNRVIKQFERFYGSRVYPCSKYKFHTVMYYQLDTYLEILIRNAIHLEQDILDIKTLIHYVLPKIMSIQQPDVTRFLITIVNKLLVQLGCNQNSVSIVRMELINGNSSIMPTLNKALTMLMEQKRKTHNCMITPLPKELKEFIWNIFFNANKRVTQQELHATFEHLFDNREILHLFQLLKLHKEMQSPNEIKQLVSLFKFKSFKKLHFFFECICTSQTLQASLLDYESVCQIHQTMLHTKFKILSNVQQGPSYYREMYKIYYTFCCNRLASASQSLLYGHASISLDYHNAQQVCVKKVIKKVDKPSKSVAQPNQKKPINAEDDVSKPKVRLRRKLEHKIIKDALNELYFQKTKDLHQELRLHDHDDTFFTSILESMKNSVVQRLPILEIDQLIKEISDPTVEDISPILDKFSEISKNIDVARFKNQMPKDQNKIARSLKKLRQPTCANNPPAIELCAFGRRIYHGKDKRPKKAYQHCLSCGNFTTYQDENWDSYYQCFTCWLSTLAIVCRCVYCTTVSYHTLDKVQQAKKPKKDKSVSVAQSFISLHYQDTNDSIAPTTSLAQTGLTSTTTTPSTTSAASLAASSAASAAAKQKAAQNAKSTADKEKQKKFSDVLKTQNRLRVYHEWLHVTTFPILYFNPLDKGYWITTMREKLQFNDTIILGWLYKQQRHNQINVNSKLLISKSFTQIPVFFNCYFCNSHLPVNPTIVKKINDITQQPTTNGSNYSKPNQTTSYIYPSNFGLNNPYRILFLEPYWKLLASKSKIKIE